MFDSPLILGVGVLTIVGITLTLMTVFRLADSLVFLAQLAFVAATVGAVLGALSNHPFTEYAVWIMYGAGLMLAALMVWRTIPKKSQSPEFED